MVWSAICIQRSDEELPGGGRITTLATPKFRLVFMTGFLSESDARSALKRKHENL